MYTITDMKVSTSNNVRVGTPKPSRRKNINQFYIFSIMWAECRVPGVENNHLNEKHSGEQQCMIWVKHKKKYE